MTLKRIVLIAFVLIPFHSICAHPHMMLINRCVVHWEGKQIRGITMEWEFDKFFSADISFYYDQDKNGLYDQEETDEVFQYAFSNLENYNYFIFFREGSRRFSPEKIEDFTVRNVDDETVSYSFYIPLDQDPGGKLNIAVYDFSFFCYVKYDEETPVELDYEAGSVEPVFHLAENKEYPVYYDPFSPATDLSLHTEWRPGLETFYPTEIQIDY